MIEACRIFEGLSLEHLRGLIEEKHLAAYLNKPETSLRFAKLKNPKWEGDTISCRAIVLDNKGKKIRPIPDEDGNPSGHIMYLVGISYQYIYVKRSYLKFLQDTTGRSNEPSTIETSETRINIQRVKGMLDEEGLKIINDSEQVSKKQKSAKGEMPEQLKRKGKVGPLKQILEGGIKDYYGIKKERPKSLVLLLDFIRETYLDQFGKFKRTTKQRIPDGLSKLERLGKTDMECLKRTSFEKWYPKWHVNRAFEEIIWDVKIT